MAINAGGTVRELDAQAAGKRYTLSAKELESPTVELNGRELQVNATGVLPTLDGAPVSAGRVRLEPRTISFFAFPEAANAACR